MSDGLALGLTCVIGGLFIFFCGFFAAYEPRPTELTNDCIIYGDVYYCPTDMPEGLVMPVEW
jgi:hypothetical protein